MKKLPDEWLKEPKFKGLKILDPDGWDRNNFLVSWNTPLTEKEFIDKVCVSTCEIPVDFHKNLNKASIEMNETIKLVPGKSDKDLAEEIRKEFIEAYGPVFKILEKAHSYGFVVSSQTALDMVSGKMHFNSLQILKTF